MNRTALVALALLVPMLARAAGPLGFDDARHLLNRTSYAASPGEILDFAKLTREQAVERLFSWTGRPSTTPPPEWTARFDPLPRLQAMSEEERKAWQQEQFRKAVGLKDWWLTEMLVTASPLTEKMTLFWHNHFVSSLQKVRLADAHVPAEPALPAPCARQLRRAAARGFEGPGDGGLPRQRIQPQGPAQRELRARGDGALHAGRGELHRARRQGGRARLHRLEHRPRHGRVRVPRRAPRRRTPKRCSAAPATSTATPFSTSCSRSRRPRSSSSPSSGASSSRPRRIRSR